MKLETSATWRAYAAVFCLLMGSLFFWLGTHAQGAQIVAVAGAVWLFFAASLLLSRWKIRRKMQALDYQARAIAGKLYPHP